MSLETAVILSLALPAFVLAWFGFKIKDQHSVLKMFIGSIAQILLLGIPLTGYHFAKSAGYSSVADYVIYFELAVIVEFVIYVFYLIWTYIEDAGLAMSKEEKDFEGGLDQ